MTRSAESTRQLAGSLRSTQGGSVEKSDKSDRIDARKLAELVRTQQLHSVYHGEHVMGTLKELGAFI